MLRGIMVSRCYFKSILRCWERLLGVRCHQYADGSQLSFSVTSGVVMNAMDQCLDAVLGLIRTNKLSLNPGKVEAL